MAAVRSARHSASSRQGRKLAYDLLLNVERQSALIRSRRSPEPAGKSEALIYLDMQRDIFIELAEQRTSSS